jgi:hypothetical protein
VTSAYPDRCFAFDQFGPLSIRPCHGARWAPRSHPARLRATYHRTHGIRYFRTGVANWSAPGLQVKERAEYPPHGGQLVRGNGADTAVQALVGDRPGVLGAGERRQLAQSRRL